MTQNTPNSAQSKQAKKAAIAYRRKLVSALYLSHVSEEEIARRLKVDQSTISRDIKSLKQIWSQEATADIQQFIIRELAELNEMENQAAIEFGKTDGQHSRWLLVRLAIKDRKYKLLGLDKKVIELSGKVAVENIDAIRAARWKAAESSLAEAFFSQALDQTGYNLIPTNEGGVDGNNN